MPLGWPIARSLLVFPERLLASSTTVGHRSVLYRLCPLFMPTACASRRRTRPQTSRRLFCFQGASYASMPYRFIVLPHALNPHPVTLQPCIRLPSMCGLFRCSRAVPARVILRHVGLRSFSAHVPFSNVNDGLAAEGQLPCLHASHAHMT
ncbi:hypothetical protein C8T65DRAFT_154695 [Cerioporus squamosus]|nr:hypothetical protein C8T65DRAFT_154695 [Cerioporus squamosus]